MAKLTKKALGVDANENGALKADDVAKQLGVKFKIRNFDLAAFIVSDDFKAYDDTFKKAFIELVGGGVPVAYVYRRVQLSQEMRDRNYHLPQFVSDLMAAVPADAVDYCFQNKATSVQMTKDDLLNHATMNYVFVPIRSWKEEAAFLYKKYVALVGVEPAKTEESTKKK